MPGVEPLEEAAEEVFSGEPPRPLKWVPVVASLGVERKRVRLRSGEERVYKSYRVRLPRRVVEELGLREGTVLLLVAKPRWYHLIDYRVGVFRERFRALKDWVKAEICMLGGAPEDECRDYRIVPLIASEDELRRLGLRPGEPVTLRELAERLRSDGLGGSG
ncbi:MAG: AbrB/MazE/SpoVT family DNA-binding domain-containing protein [Crenarchaeota archaeon]|nr:AbrB/MazE/SpoVT family DNA-binding domain-containing protein [Thermoproteota archaeon]